MWYLFMICVQFSICYLLINIPTHPREMAGHYDSRPPATESQCGKEMLGFPFILIYRCNFPLALLVSGKHFFLSRVYKKLMRCEDAYMSAIGGQSVCTRHYDLARNTTNSKDVGSCMKQYESLSVSEGRTRNRKKVSLMQTVGVSGVYYISMILW